jgi:hypothetical protein
MSDMNFNDLNFKEKDTGGIHAIMKFPNGNVLSVVAGSGMYSTPRENHNSPDDFSAFEIAIFGPDGGWATQNFFPNCGDDVMGWQSREEINSIIELIG